MSPVQRVFSRLADVLYLPDSAPGVPPEARLVVAAMVFAGLGVTGPNLNALLSAGSRGELTDDALLGVLEQEDRLAVLLMSQGLPEVNYLPAMLERQAGRVTDACIMLATAGTPPNQRS